jgi:hypothetical protein
VTFAKFLDGFLAGAGSAVNSDIGCTVNEAFKALEHDRMIVGDQDMNQGS